MSFLLQLLRPLLRPAARLVALYVVSSLALIGAGCLIDRLAGACGTAVVLPVLLATAVLLHLRRGSAVPAGHPPLGAAPGGPAGTRAAPAAGRQGQLVVLWSDERPEADGTWTRALRVLVHVRRLPPAAAPLLHGLFLAARLVRRVRRGLASDAPGDAPSPW